MSQAPWSQRSTRWQTSKTLSALVEWTSLLHHEIPESKALLSSLWAEALPKLSRPVSFDDPINARLRSLSERLWSSEFIGEPSDLASELTLDSGSDLHETQVFHAFESSLLDQSEDELLQQLITLQRLQLERLFSSLDDARLLLLKERIMSAGKLRALSRLSLEPSVSRPAERLLREVSECFCNDPLLFHPFLNSPPQIERRTQTESSFLIQWSDWESDAASFWRERFLDFCLQGYTHCLSANSPDETVFETVTVSPNSHPKELSLNHALRIQWRLSRSHAFSQLLPSKA